MPPEKKIVEAKRLLPLIKNELPKNAEFAVWEISGRLNLIPEDRQILLHVQEEVTAMLVRSELFKYSRPDESKYHIERIIVDEYSEHKHHILQYLFTNSGWHFANEIANELKLDFDTVHFLVSEMQQENAVNLKDTSTFDGPDFMVQISGIGKGYFLQENYLKQPKQYFQPMHINNQSVTVTGDGNVVSQGNNGKITTSVVKDNSEDPEAKALALQSFRWTRKQTLWTIAGVIIATLLTVWGMYLAGYFK